MKDLPPFLNWLVLICLADWLVTRTLMRMAIFMPKSPPVAVLYQALGIAGQLAAALSSLLVMLLLGWMAWHSVRLSRQMLFPLACLSLILLNLIFLVFPPVGWFAAGYHLILIVSIALLGMRALGGAGSPGEKTASGLLALALLVRELYQILPAVYQAFELPGPAISAQAIFNGGELLVLLSLFPIWWVYGRPGSWRIWLAASILPLVFAILRYLSPAMLGILTIWSTGFTLYLPWPLYGLGLWLAGVTIVVSLKKGNLAGWAVLLLFAGGLAPQLSTQALLGLIALWMLRTPAVYDERTHSQEGVRSPAGRSIMGQV
jgi:hypothetical protein